MDLLRIPAKRSHPPRRVRVVDSAPTSARCEEIWRTRFLPLVDTAQGIDLGIIKGLLADYLFLGCQAEAVYTHLTGGRVSVVDVTASEVIDAATEYRETMDRTLLAAERARSHSDTMQAERRYLRDVDELQREITRLRAEVARLREGGAARGVA